MALQVFTTQSRGTKTGRAVLAEEAARVEASRLVVVYENHEFDLPFFASATALDDVVNHAAAFPGTGCSCQRASTGASTAAFSLIARAQRVSVRNMGGGPIIVRLGDVLADPITVDAGEYMDWNFVEVSNLFLKNTGVACPVRIVLS